MRSIKLQIDDSLITDVTSLEHNVDENNILITIKDQLEEDSFQENLNNWSIQALYHGNRTYTVYYNNGFKVTLP